VIAAGVFRRQRDPEVGENFLAAAMLPSLMLREIPWPIRIEPPASLAVSDSLRRPLPGAGLYEQRDRHIGVHGRIIRRPAGLQCGVSGA